MVSSTEPRGEDEASSTRDSETEDSARWIFLWTTPTFTPGNLEDATWWTDGRVRGERRRARPGRAAPLTSSSRRMKACAAPPGRGGRDTCASSASPLASVSRHTTNATLSCSGLDSGEGGRRSEVRGRRRSGHAGRRPLTGVVQVVLQPALGAQEVVLPSSSEREHQVEPSGGQTGVRGQGSGG
ncbi:hypothetical protein EYF80_068364 [Liparis tanakae]|uniref:Uncharacterized protein n=1 Tax=Liparis tanakae TaxID=230148 RepID=A0A4Z2DY75_9TELE|nr:hypothetical protein EYF80_068364 [Liparis tanakae]